MFDTNKWQEDNRNKILEYHKDYGKRDDVQKKIKERYERNKERLRARALERYAAKSKEALKANRQALYKRNKEKWRNDPAFQARTSLQKVMKLRKPNPERWLAEVGCVKEEFINHIESLFQEGMTWDNRGNDGWHIDHIVPLTKGGTNHYTNLQPLWAEDNRKKAATVDKEQ